MGLEAAHFLELVETLKEIERRPVHLLSLGYPDLVVNPEILKPYRKKVKKLQDGEAIAKWHGVTDTLYDTTGVFKNLGIVPTYVDINPSRGVEARVDLNILFKDAPLFDIVLDPGTIEHCFDIANAFRNVYNSLKEGGYVLHLNPVSMVNHGFYNLCPSVYSDFYGQNGCEVISMKLLRGALQEREVVLLPLPANQRFMVPGEPSLIVKVRKGKHQEVKTPTQTKYIINKELKGA